MNINAGTNQYNLSLKKMKEEKRPTFATIFDKLDARSKKLNPKNPLNAVMTNDQMYRYYLEETEPMLREIPDDYDLLDDVIGGKSLKDMKLSEFAKLLSGDLDGDRNVKYETLVATISPTPAAPIVPSMISIASPPTPPPSAPSAPIIPAPSSSVASSIAAPTAVSGLMPTGSGSIPTAPSGTGSAPAAAGSGLSVTIPSALSAVASAFSPSTYFASLLGGGTPPAAAITPPAAAAAAAKPSPSGASIPPSAVASAATTAPATGVPTATPASGALSPSAGAAGGGAAGGGGVSPSAVASSITATDTGYYDRFFTTSNTDTNPSIYNNALKAGLSPPKIPDSIAIKGDKFSSKNLEWVKHINDMNQYNKGINDPTGEFSFSFTPTQNKLINALEKNGNNAQKVYELIINKKIKL